MEIPRFGAPVDVAQWGALVLGGALVAFSLRARSVGAAPPSGGRARSRIVRTGPKYERLFVAGLAVIAAALSWGYVLAYLRGGPRIIDATSYYLEARGFAAGHVTFPVGESETSVLGRFLVRSDTADGVRAAVLFPPGYPAILALGFLVGAPLAVGPLLAALLVIATYALAREVVASARSGDRGGEPAGGEDAGSREFEGVPMIAAGLSVVCGALRYHTAETMSHGLAALCFAGAVTFFLRAVRRGTEVRKSLVSAAIGGAFGGLLFATRPASGLALGVVAAALLFADRLGNKVRRANTRASLGERMGLLGAAIAAAVPFVVAFAVHQRLATGAWGTTTHAAHYALNDGPAGCFRYGFGDGIGCFGEHGDFVRANLPHGFGFVAAVKTTARRLWMHLVDAGNVELLALFVPLGAALAWRLRGARVITLAIGALIAAYAPFYFDGNYPGGGGRMFADGLPFEHVLIALAAVGLSSWRAQRRDGVPQRRPDVASGGAPPAARGAAEPRARRLGGADGATDRRDERRPGVGNLAGAWIVGVSMIAFGVRAGFDHAQLRDRDGGAPMFVEGDRERLGVTKGLVFVDSDAMFDLAFDPSGRAGPSIARWKGDALDAFVMRERGETKAFLMRFEAPSEGERGADLRLPAGVAASGLRALAGTSRAASGPRPPSVSRATLLPYAPSESQTPWIEGGSLWPPRAQEGGAYALVAFAGGTCAQSGKLLRVLRSENEGDPTQGVRLSIPAALVRGRVVEVSLLVGPAPGQRAPAAASEESGQRAASASGQRAPAAAEVAIVIDGVEARTSIVVPGEGAPACVRGARVSVPPGATRVEIVVLPQWQGVFDPEAQPLVAIDRVLLLPAD